MLYFSLMHQQSKIGWRPEYLCGTPELHKHSFKILTGTKWACIHGAYPLHLGYSGTQCVDNFRGPFWGGFLSFPKSIFKHCLKDENPSLPPHFKKFLQENKESSVLFSYPQIAKCYYMTDLTHNFCRDVVQHVRKEPCSHLSLISPIRAWSFSMLEITVISWP